MNYVKLGPNAESFSDPTTGFNIAKGEVKQITSEVKNSPKIRRALTGGHLSSSDEKSYNAFIEKEKKRQALKVDLGLDDTLKSSKEKEYQKTIKKAEAEKVDLANKNLELQERIAELEAAGATPIKLSYKDMVKADLVKHYVDTYEVTEADISEFKVKSKDEMIEELEELDKATEE